MNCEKTLIYMYDPNRPVLDHPNIVNGSKYYECLLMLYQKFEEENKISKYAPEEAVQYQQNVLYGMAKAYSHVYNLALDDITAKKEYNERMKTFYKDNWQLPPTKPLVKHNVAELNFDAHIHTVPVSGPVLEPKKPVKEKNISLSNAHNSSSIDFGKPNLPKKEAYEKFNTLKPVEKLKKFNKYTGLVKFYGEYDFLMSIWIAVHLILGVISLLSIHLGLEVMSIYIPLYSLSTFFIGLILYLKMERRYNIALLRVDEMADMLLSEPNAFELTRDLIWETDKKSEEEKFQKLAFECPKYVYGTKF